MARYIEQGESIFIPFQHGVSMSDSQLHLRMYKTTAAFERHCPKGGGEPELFEYVPIVRCKDCKRFDEYTSKCYVFCDNECEVQLEVDSDHFCSYGERKTNVN